MNSELQRSSFFVVTATVAAELHKAMLVARKMSLIASNARAIAQRAGHRAAGFRALTGFIDELATKTVKASLQINALAIETSRTAVATSTNEYAAQKFKLAYELGKGNAYIESITTALKKTEEEFGSFKQVGQRQVRQLINTLDEMARELRSAIVLAAMSRVEASQAGSDMQQPLEVIANSVAEAAEEIKIHVQNSQALFNQI